MERKRTPLITIALRVFKVLFASWAMTFAVLLAAGIVALFVADAPTAETIWDGGWWQFAVWLVSLGVCWRFLKTR
ncbi:hypothetical protein LYSHEL_04320 [Lysobacter helvus]|uniref:Uncharacterized protein n=2 Tax=Lysobacteraceae TaxID=32033 RepID=A0ABN6FUI8_9GAMM|nr:MULTISPECIES: hypothetical protein [Lysobacter]BCT91408.1 hypothetical protein LYSCAS_04320 [Lysobacter caseinilyticus]BCT94561.1 hypothetical protein LYSHEL_04320 [Lysobacter helvus]